MPPLSILNDGDAREAKINRSLMERFCDASPNFSTLTIQYRMHRSIQNIVSALSYGGLLSTGAIERTRQPAVVWHNSRQPEEKVGMSYRNTGEADVCEEVYLRERSKHPEQSILIIVRYSPTSVVVSSLL